MSGDPWLAAMPKCELHVHLEGTLGPKLCKELAKRNDIPIPCIFGDDGNYLPFHDLYSFLDIYYKAMDCIRTKADYKDLIMGYLDKANEQNVMHVEMFFDPQAHASQRKITIKESIETILGGVVEGLGQSQSYDIDVKMIMCFQRENPEDEAMKTLNALITTGFHKTLVIGVGLDSYEGGGEPDKFKDVYAAAKKAGLKTTMHCDIDQPNSIEHIRQALHDIKVDRLDHGTNIIENSSLVKEIIDKKIGLTCCPVSNSFVEGVTDFKGPVIKSLLDKGAKVTINSDDPAFMGAYVNENLEKMLTVAGVTLTDMIRVQYNAIDIAWIDDVQRKSYRVRLSNYVRRKHGRLDDEDPPEYDQDEEHIV